MYCERQGLSWTLFRPLTPAAIIDLLALRRAKGESDFEITASAAGTA